MTLHCNWAAVGVKCCSGNVRCGPCLLVFKDVWQNATVFIVVGAVILAFAVQLDETVKCNHRTGGAERDLLVGGFDVDPADLIEPGSFHLAGDGPLPDQGVERS